jgi:hypothetical protein
MGERDFVPERWDRCKSPPLRLLNFLTSVRINVEISCRAVAVQHNADHEDGGDDEPEHSAVHKGIRVVKGRSEIQVVCTPVFSR